MLIAVSKSDSGKTYSLSKTGGYGNTPAEILATLNEEYQRTQSQVGRILLQQFPNFVFGVIDRYVLIDNAELSMMPNWPKPGTPDYDTRVDIVDGQLVVTPPPQ